MIGATITASPSEKRPSADDARRPEVRLVLDEEEDERAEPHERGAERQEEARAVRVGEGAESRGQEDHDDARRDVDEPGLERREAQELQVEGGEHEEAVEARVDEERLDVGDREVALAEEREGEHRLLRAPLDDDERGESGDRSREGPPDVGKPLVGALDEAVREEPEAERGERGAREVETTRTLRRALALEAPREGEQDRSARQRQVDEEDPPPRDPLDEGAPQPGGPAIVATLVNEVQRPIARPASAP